MQNKIQWHSISDRGSKSN